MIGVSPETSARLLFADGGSIDLDDVLAEVASLEHSLVGRPLPSAVDLIRRLSAGGAPVALVSGASSARLARTTQALGIADVVAASVTWGEARGKPAPDPYLLAADRLGVAPEECVVVEDAVAGVRSGSSAGCHVVAVLTPGAPLARAAALLDAGAQRVISSLTALRVARTGHEIVVTADHAVTAGGEIVPTPWQLHFDAAERPHPIPEKEVRRW